MNRKTSIFIILILSLSFAIGICETSYSYTAESAADWPGIRMESKPWTFWWWMGSAVEKDEITRLLETYSRAGLGGVHIIPIYGAIGWEKNYLKFLSPEWMEALKHTESEAKRLSMGVDMTTGTGWPFGGPQIRPETASSKFDVEIFNLKSGERIGKSLDAKGLQAVIVYSDSGEVDDITSRLEESGAINWEAPAGNWKVYAAYMRGTGQKVKRAAPGGEGLVMDHFSETALNSCLSPFDKAFEASGAPPVRAFYNDSYEVYGANWTADFLSEFQKRRGYDLRLHFPALMGEGGAEYAGRVKCDYRETLSDLLLERFAMPWTLWSHKRGSITRYQAHGSPGNLLDLYASADIPETEAFGPSGFNIPGLPVRKGIPQHFGKPDVLMMKFASSASHTAGKQLTSSESCTWLGEHFTVSLSQVKPEMDQLFVSGINHVIFHGTAYSPSTAKWPGWLFYASVNFGPTNTFYRDFPQLTTYISRVQSFLQSGR
ncbi:MAG: glycosyl hydrolase, partial [bacterium]